MALRHHRARCTCSAQRPSQINAYLPFILETLTKFPSLTSSRMYAMVCERGYRGNHHPFRYLVSLHRPRPVAEAYLRLRPMRGEQGQGNWGLCRARHGAEGFCYAECPRYERSSALNRRRKPQSTQHRFYPALWASFGHRQIRPARRPLMASVIFLSWPRQIYLHFFRDAHMDSFLSGHVGAFVARSMPARISQRLDRRCS